MNGDLQMDAFQRGSHTNEVSQVRSGFPSASQLLLVLHSIYYFFIRYTASSILSCTYETQHQAPNDMLA